MSIKPVAWMYQRVDCEDCSLSFQKWPDEDVTESWREEPLYAIPDTHRLVPVELLSRIMELAGVALVYQPFGTKDRQNFHALMAIIEDKP